MVAGRQAFHLPRKFRRGQRPLLRRRRTSSGVRRRRPKAGLHRPERRSQGPGIDPKGGIYFTDPRYGNRDGMEQDGEHAYYLSPDRKKLVRVIDDMVRPNGVIGTPDGKTLYVTDNGGGKTFAYKIEQDGTLSGKKLIAPIGSDGMTIDNEGNIYLTRRVVAVYNKNGEKIEEIKVPEGPSNVTFGGKGPSNVTFGGKNGHTLFITARTSLYSVKMRVKGAKRAQAGPESKFEQDIIKTSVGDLKITFIGHGTLMFTFNGKIIHVDPVTRGPCQQGGRLYRHAQGRHYPANTRARRPPRPGGYKDSSKRRNAARIDQSLCRKSCRT